VAVLGFRNSSGRAEDAWLSTALSEMFSTELAAGDHLRLVSGEDIVHIRLAQPKLDVDSLSTATAKQLRAALDTDLIVSGSYAAVDGGESRLVRLDVRLQDANSGEILTEVSENGTEKALFQLVGNVGERLRQKLGVSGISDAEHTQVLASMPANREAGELYSNGLVKLRAYDAVGDVRGKGLMMGVELVRDKKTKAPFAPADAYPAQLYEALLAQNVMVRVAAGKVILSPPLVFTEEYVDEAMAALHAAFKSVKPAS